MNLRFFDYEHLPREMQEVVAPIHEVATLMETTLAASAEKSAGMRKLLEAKDCFVRAVLPQE